MHCVSTPRLKQTKTFVNLLHPIVNSFHYKLKCMRYLSVVALLFIVSAASAQGRQERGRITIDSTQRSFVVYVPSVTDTLHKLPLIISLHLAQGTGERMMELADFRPIADREKFLIVCPDGIDRGWNDGRLSRERNDVKFIDELITYIVNKYNGDPSRVYVTGISNGGFMATRLACELNNRIAAIASVAGTMGRDVTYLPGKPVPVMYIHGTKDPLVPYNGGLNVRTGSMVYSHDEMLKLWVGADHCRETPVITSIPDSAQDGTTIIKEEYANPATGVKVIGYTITNGGHTWPDGKQYLPRLVVGRVSHNLNACEVIWAFFKQYRLGE